MNFHLLWDEFSSSKWIFIFVMNFHLHDEFSSSWSMNFHLCNKISSNALSNGRVFISVINFHMKSKVSHYWWFQPPWRNFIIWMNFLFSTNWAYKIKEESFNAFHTSKHWFFWSVDFTGKITPQLLIHLFLIVNLFTNVASYNLVSFSLKFNLNFGWAWPSSAPACSKNIIVFLSWAYFITEAFRQGE